VKLFSLKKLAENVNGLSEAKLLLADADIPVIEGYFDADRLDAVMSMPKELRSKRLEWSLASTSGLGAVKACIDKAELNLSAHYLDRRNSLDITNKKGKTRHVRMHYTNQTSQENSVATFNLQNFIDHHPDTYYALCALGIPAMWVFSNAQLRAIHKKLRFTDSKDHAAHKINSTACPGDTGIWITRGQWKYQHGYLRFKLSAHESQYRVSTETLGL